MNKNLILFLISILTIQVANAQVIKVETITPFTTNNPPNKIELRALDKIQLTKYITVTEGDILTGTLADVKSPKRLKRDATFNFEIKSISDNFGQTTQIKENNIAKYTPENKINKGEIVKSTALTVGNHFVKGLTVGYRAIEGAVEGHSEGENIVKGAVENVYETSALSYVEKGQDLSFKKGDEFYLKLNNYEEIEAINNKNAPNYSFELEN